MVESYLLFDSGRDTSLAGSNDIYISYRDDDGSWSNAENIGDPVNTEFADLRPFVTADGKYLFFVSDRMAEGGHETAAQSIGEIRRVLDGPGNGLQDIYWVSTEVLPLKNAKDGDHVRQSQAVRP